MMKLAFVFPGQGSQAVGMLNDMVDLPVVKNTVIEASDALGVDLLDMMQNGPAEALNLTVLNPTSWRGTAWANIPL